MFGRVFTGLVFLVLYSCGYAVDDQNVTRSLDEDSKKRISAKLAEFTVILTKSMIQESLSKNTLFSPLNIYSALAVGHLSAEGATRKEFANVLGWPDVDDEVPRIRKNFGQMLRSLNVDTKRAPFTKVKLASGIFVDNLYPIKKSFEKQLHEYYKEGHVQNVDFLNQRSFATDSVNKWAFNATDGRISKLFSESLSSDTTVLVATSLYFSGKWDEPFYERFTMKDTFHAEDSTMEVQMMNKIEYVPYKDNKYFQYQAIIKHYAGRNYSMVFVLPYETQSLKNLTGYLNTAELQNIMKNSQSIGVDCKIPRMKFSVSKSLKPILKQQGLVGAFAKADLSNLLAAPIQLSDIYHAAEIEIDERGTKASVITALQFVYLSAPIHPKNPLKFYLNRPFLLGIYHYPTSSFLFVGLVNKPND